MTRGTLNNVGKAPAGIQPGEPGEDSHTYSRLMAKKPAAPIVGNTATKQGPHENGKSNAAGKQRTDGGKPNGSLKAKPKPAGGTTRTESPMGHAAKKLYPSAK
ncbi:hypothetical protein [Paraburkholderia sp. HD33-4]|uniref:hypothetical protein n=1 Tax=Paraburkholderia sp. HD33-4 TaxID=2883242 RepID=UPI001F1A2A8C|nr:hypothetical protein [Paraburkholderia sp. HD33-4]